MNITYTTRKKWDNVWVSPSGHGHYRVTIKHLNQEYHAVTDNMPMIDRFKSKEYGWKKAGNDLYDFVKRKNGLK